MVSPFEVEEHPVEDEEEMIAQRNEMPNWCPKYGLPERARQEDERPYMSCSFNTELSYYLSKHTLLEKLKLYGGREITTVLGTSCPYEASIVKDVESECNSHCVSCHKPLPPILCNLPSLWS